MQHDQTTRALAAFGLDLVDQPDDRPDPGAAAELFYLWPENWPVWCIWRDLETQLRGYGIDGGAPGLDYAAAQIVIAQQTRRKDRRTVFFLIQAMEEAALGELRDQAKRDAERLPV